METRGRFHEGVEDINCAGEPPCISDTVGRPPHELCLSFGPELVVFCLQESQQR